MGENTMHISLSATLYLLPVYETFLKGKKQFNNQNSRIWGCVGDRVEMVVKVQCWTVLGDEFAAMLEMRPPEQSHNALWNHLDPVSRATSSSELGEPFLKLGIVN